MPNARSRISGFIRKILGDDLSPSQGGQSGAYAGAIMSRVPAPPLLQYPPMEEPEFNKALRGRLKELRVSRDLTQQEVADRIGITLDRYKKYESRSKLPVYLIPRLAGAFDVSLYFLLLGRHPSEREARRSRPRVVHSRH